MHRLRKGAGLHPATAFQAIFLRTLPRERDLSKIHRMRSISAAEYCSLIAVHCPLRTHPSQNLQFSTKCWRDFARSNSDQFSPTMKSSIKPMSEATQPGQPARCEVEGASPRSTQVPTLTSECA